MNSTASKNRALWPYLTGALAATCLSFGAPPAWAALGQTADSVVSDQQLLHGALHSIEGQGFVVQEITLADGSAVREYLSHGGSVFAVVWRGTTPPNLAQLLGPHFEEFQKASHSTTRRHRPLVVRTPRLIVEMGGHMRAFLGRAYLPDKLPETLSSDAIR